LFHIIVLYFFNKLRANPFGRFRVTKNPSLILGLTLFPSPKLIIILENRDYIAKMKEKLAEIRKFYESLRTISEEQMTLKPV
jgi:hypothetical protein